MKLRCFWKGEKNNKNNFIDFLFFKIGGLTELGRVAQYTWCDWFYLYMSVCLSVLYPFYDWLSVCFPFCVILSSILSPYVLTENVLYLCLFYFVFPVMFNVIFPIFFLSYFPFCSHKAWCVCFYLFMSVCLSFSSSLIAGI